MTMELLNLALEVDAWIMSHARGAYAYAYAYAYHCNPGVPTSRSSLRGISRDQKGSFQRLRF